MRNEAHFCEFSFQRSQGMSRKLAKVTTKFAKFLGNDALTN